MDSNHTDNHNVGLAIEYLPIEALEPYAGNTRKHADADIEQIMTSISRNGFCDPIGIWSDHQVIVEGHGRLEAAKRLGMSEVPVIRLDHMTDEQRREYGIMHNKTAELSEWDFEKLESELEDIDLSAYGIEFEAGAQQAVQDTEEELLQAIEEDEVPEPTEPEQLTRTHRGDVWKLGDHRLIVGDSTEPTDIERLMDGAQADMVVTDPPYNVAISNSAGATIQNDNTADEMFFDFLVKAFRTLEAALKPGGAFYVWFADRTHIAFEQALAENGLTVRQELIWVKNALILCRRDYQWRHESCFYGWKDGASHYFVPDRSQTTVVEDIPPVFRKLSKYDLVKLLEDLYAKWDETPSTVIHEKKPLVDDLHPTMKPVKLIARQIRNSSQRGEIVLDLFGGSGTTLLAAEQLGRRAYICEIDEHYADVILDRWEKFTGRKAEKID